MTRRRKQHEFITLTEIFQTVKDSASQPHFLALYRRAAQENLFVGIPLEETFTVADQKVPDELIRSSAQLKKWMDELPINIKLHRLEAGEDVGFTREEAMRHYNEIARLKAQRGAARAAPKKGSLGKAATPPQPALQGSADAD
ncbi:hypothetical protein [Deinococcus petrolearius]|uniref:Uncharacterized protein n=1 Tax=Deinococcus petrolearius TaxID=1751295 RepID=A0ABW1DMV7_9DEIO